MKSPDADLAEDVRAEANAGFRTLQVASKLCRDDAVDLRNSLDLDGSALRADAV